MLTKNKKKNIKPQKSNQNRQIYVVMYLFVLLFLAMMGNFIYYIYFKSPEDINNTYNTRQENLAMKVVRGKILSKDRDILAETLVNDDGTEMRNYPYGDTFSHVVGFCQRGKTGVESLANISLLTSNANISERISNEIADEKNIGDNVITTLDVKLQQTARETLGIYKGAIIALEPSTGKILAMYSNPGFDPNHVKRDWDLLNEQTDDSPLLNRATQGLYPPGSTFKIVTLLEFLRENDDPEDYAYNCNGKYVNEDITVNCYHGSNHGYVDLKKSFAKSCNSSFANIGNMLDAESFQKTADDLLFNKELPYKLPYTKSQFSYSSDSGLEEKLHTAIGQGKTLITPYHLALITSAIANNGVAKNTMLIDRIENYQGAIIKQYNSSNFKRIMSEDEANELKYYMTNVVNEGTGSKLANLSYTVAGKTGSAEFGNSKGESHAWFTGFSNVEDPDLVVTVIVEGAGSGGDYAVPMAKRMFDAYYD